MSKVDEDISNQVIDLPSKKRKTQEKKESEEVEVESTGGDLKLAGIESNSDAAVELDGNITDKGKTIEFLENRGFSIEQADDKFEIRVTHRSLGVGLNEIFVESDEIEGIKQLGNLVKIIYSEEVLILIIQQ
ncbi:MAG: hypothetical protein M3530_00960 [Thermoproteota archaeon]|nr:hypothetical protein [Thermoproteota archaeon]